MHTFTHGNWLPGDSQEYNKALDQAVKYLVEWFVRGQNGAFEAIGRTASDQVHRMASDGDLSLVCANRQAKLKESIPNTLWPKQENGSRNTTSGRRSSGCIPVGTLIDTPEGKFPIEKLRQGDVVMSLNYEYNAHLLRAEVVDVVTSRSAQCVRLNRSWLVTPEQPVYTSLGWVEAGALRKGDSVME